MSIILQLQVRKKSVSGIRKIFNIAWYPMVCLITSHLMPFFANNACTKRRQFDKAMPITQKSIARLSSLHSHRPVASLLSYHSYGSVFSTCIAPSASLCHDIATSSSHNRAIIIAPKLNVVMVSIWSCSDSLLNNGGF